MIGNLSSAASAAVSPLSLSRPPSSQSPTRFSRSICMASVQAFSDLDSARKSVNLYEILRIGPNASPVEIKSAYRNLAKRFHPDSSRNSESESGGQCFIEIHNAYATLSDPAARSVYDLSLELNRRRRLGFSVGKRSEIFRSRRWETDQCW